MTAERPPSPLASHLGYWLRFVSNHVSLAFAQKLEGRGVTVAEWALMRELLDAGEVPPSRLADRLGLTRGAITRLADRLIAKGLMHRRADPEDGRAQTLSLTARGLALVPDLAALADANDARFFDHLSPADRATLRRILNSVVVRRDLKSVPID